MKRAYLLLAPILFIVACAITSAVAAGPEVKTIVTQMKRGLQGPNNAVRIMELKVINNGSPAVTWKLVQANGNANGAHWILTVVLAPPDARGIAFLDKEETSSTSTVKYAYLPATRRLLLQSHKLHSDRFIDARRARFLRPRWQALQDRALHDRDG